MSTQPHAYCPQCGYDLSGQTVERCPECNFHYDKPALRELVAGSFNQSCEPYIAASRFLAPAGVLAVASLLRSNPLAVIALAYVFLASPALIQVWIVRQTRGHWVTEELYGLAYFGRIIRIVLMFFAFIAIAGAWLNLATIVVGCALLIGLVWTCLSLWRHAEMTRQNQVLSLEPEHRAILQRARTAAWTLILFDLATLMAMAAQL